MMASRISAMTLGSVRLQPLAQCLPRFGIEVVSQESDAIALEDGVLSEAPKQHSML